MSNVRPRNPHPTSASWSSARSNEGMKLTSAVHMGRSQLIPGVGRTFCRASEAPARHA